jgi:FkbM family methyltransferase
MFNSSNKLSLAVYDGLSRVRPQQVADVLKSMLRIRRRVMEDGFGHRFWIDPVSRLGRHLIHNETYEPGLTRIVMTLLRPGSVFVDIGGNEGYYSILAARRVEANGQVHCLEPQNRLQSVLAKNRELNNCQNLTIHRLALTDKAGEASLYLRPSLNTGASSLTPHWRIGRRQERVPTMSLDEFFSSSKLDRVRLIKVDCEGAEGLVIDGAAGVLSRRAVDFWAMEYHASICGEERCAAIHETFRAMGYHCASVSGHRIYHLPTLESDLRLLGDCEFDCDWRD